VTVPNRPGTTGPLLGNGSNNLWPFEFSIASASEIQVIRTAAAGAETIVASNLYSVTNDNPGGTVTYPLTAARVPEGDTITILLNPAFEQPSDLTREGNYDPTVVETRLDGLTRQTQALKVSQGRNLRSPLGYVVEPVIGAPVDGAGLRWQLLSTGSWVIVSGEQAARAPAEMRILYADDLGLLGDGTDELATMNAAFLELATAGKAVIVYLQAAIGYWPLTGQLIVRSGISLSMGSPFKAGKDGQVLISGSYATEGVGATVSTATAAANTVIPVTVESGVTVSGQFAIGDQIRLGSMRVRVTAVDDGALTVTVTPATTAALAVGATLRRLKHSYCTSSWTRQDTPATLAVASVAPFPIGGLVWITDDEVITHTDGVQTALCNSEMAKVLGYSGSSLVLDRPIKHAMSTTNWARAVLIDPVEYASVSGATVEFVEAPDDTQVDTFVVQLAQACALVNCRIPNEDDFGSRGQGFRFFRAYGCTNEGCFMGPPKYLDAGEGYGVEFRESTACESRNFEGVGCRHVIDFNAATDCVARAPRGQAWAINLISWHGIKEIGCWAYDVKGTGTGASGQRGLTAGNNTWLGGCFECGADGGEVTDLDGTNGLCIYVATPTDDLTVTGITFRRFTDGIYSANIDGFETVEAGKVRIACDFYRGARCGTVDMDKEGGTGKPFNRLDLTGSRFFDFLDGFKADNLDVIVLDRTVFETLRHTTNAYAVELIKITDAFVKDAAFDGCQRGILFGDTRLDLVSAVVRNPGSTTWLVESSTGAVAGCRDAYLVHPAGWTPSRTVATSTLTVLSLPGMT
jgi:hypothetical protein